MSGEIKRIFVEKKPEYAVEARGLLQDLQNSLGMKNLNNLRIINRYDLTGLSAKEFEGAKQLVLSEPPVDIVHEE